MLPAFMAGANFQLHTAGWMESGLVACFEKFALDIEILRILQREFTPLEIDEESLAFSAHEEVGHGGHFFGAVHTLERFRDCFYRPQVFSTENYDRWTRYGSLDTAARAAKRWPEWLENGRRRRSTTGVHQELRSTSPAAPPRSRPTFSRRRGRARPARSPARRRRGPARPAPSAGRPPVPAHRSRWRPSPRR